MGKGSAARLASKNAASKPSTPTSELRKLKEKSLRLEKNLRAAKDEIKTLKMDLSREKKEKSRHQEELEKQQLLFQFQKNNLEEQFERDRNMEKDSYTNQVDNLSRESERIQRKWTSEVNTLTANYKEVTKELKSLGDLAGNIVASENAGPIRVTNVEFTKKVEEMSGKVEAVRSACVAILLNATNSPLPTCKSCQVVFEEEEQEVEIGEFILLRFLYSFLYFFSSQTTDRSTRSSYLSNLLDRLQLQRGTCSEDPSLRAYSVRIVCPADPETIQD